jgi:dimethylhistidine N-methyltransferase
MNRDARSELAADVRAGLTKPGQKELLPKYFYDEVGSALFEAITVLPEYGVSRAADRLLARHAPEIAGRLALPAIAAELGSGSGKRTRLLLEALARRQPATAYYPIDLSAAALARCARELERLGSVRVHPIERSYLEGLTEVGRRRQRGEQLILLFLGSNIGNFGRAEAEVFLGAVRCALEPGDRFLLSADLEKPVGLLLAAYDDPIGVTAAFNLNLLARLNRELGADFDLARFVHVARYDEAERRIEMHLRSTADQTVTIPAARLTVSFRRGETICTESSYRYDLGEIAAMAARAGFGCEAR